MPVTDHVLGLEVTNETLQRHHNEVNLLNRLLAGLEYIYEKVKEVEAIGPRRFADPDANLPPPPLPPGVQSCAFHWYATTACDMVKMIGWLHQQQTPGADDPDDYLQKVIPAVEPWRNKVGAHSAVHTPHRKDTAADLLACLGPPTTWIKERDDTSSRLYAGAYAATITRAGKTSTSRLQQWSLTKTHEALRDRYGLSPSQAPPQPVPGEDRQPGEVGPGGDDQG